MIGFVLFILASLGLSWLIMMSRNNNLIDFSYIGKILNNDLVINSVFGCATILKIYLICFNSEIRFYNYNKYS